MSLTIKPTQVKVNNLYLLIFNVNYYYRCVCVHIAKDALLILPLICAAILEIMRSMNIDILECHEADSALR